jgi:hypothetical protein
VAQIRRALRATRLGCSYFVLLKKINDQAFPRKKDIATPTPKNPEGPSIYNTPQKILANLEVLMKVARERFYVPPGFSFPAF